MASDVARDSLYSGKINLWVEDSVTQAYLSAIWNDTSVKFLIGGGGDGVGAILRDAESASYPNVFGVIDRDHKTSNYKEWLASGKTFRGFVLPRHEIENYFLDSRALEGCVFNTHKRTATEIDEILETEAQRRCWWAACCRVISHMHDRFFDGFLKHPKTPQVETKQSATEYIIGRNWIRGLPRRLKVTHEVRVERLLGAAYAAASKTTSDGNVASRVSR